MTQVKIALCVGGIKKYYNKKSLEEGPNIVIGTPGRIVDLIEEKDADGEIVSSGILILSSLKILVIDEADEMLNSGFFYEITKIFSYCLTSCQLCLFSATFNKNVISLFY